MRDEHISALFSPKAIAVLGFFEDVESEAHLFLASLESAGYQGSVVPVNYGLSLENVQFFPGEVELTIICLPPEKVLDALTWIADQGVKAVILASSGFREAGGKGYYLEEQIVQLASARNLTLLGPNCLGVASFSEKMNASLITRMPGHGQIAFFSPSGSMCHTVLDWAVAEGVGLSRFASLGNRALLDEAAMLQFLAKDPETSVILGYLEGISNGRRFALISQSLTREKPVIMLQAGTTAYGQKASATHVGMLTGSERAYQTALRQAGIIQADSLSSLFDLARIFATQPLPDGPNLAIVTNSGGAGVLAADGMSGKNMHLAELSPKTQKILKNFLPREAQVDNPVDTGVVSPTDYARVVQNVLEDQMVHMALVVIAAGPGVDFAAFAKKFSQTLEKAAKPVLICLLGQRSGGEAHRMLQQHGLPCFSYPQAALAGLNSLLRYAEWKKKPYPVQVCYRRDTSKAERFLQEQLSAGKTVLHHFDMQPLLQAYELSVPRTELARTSKSAAKIAKRLNCPVALKIVSPHIEYKEDVDGVTTGLVTPEDVRSEFIRLTARVQCQRPSAFLSGCLLQEMISGKPWQVYVRIQRDPRFGPVVRLALCGYEGTQEGNFTERLAPLSLLDAGDMLREIKVFSRFRRERSKDFLDLRSLEDLLLTVSQMALDFPEIYTLEFDPVMISSRGTWVVGGRLTLFAVEAG